MEVSVSGDTLTLKGETSTEEKEENGDYYRHEISRMRDGLLELTLPKVERSRRRTITIS